MHYNAIYQQIFNQKNIIKKQQKNSEKFAQAKQSSKMMDELSQLKIFGGKSMEAQKIKFVQL
ncbi:hypothetical protein QUW47_14610 [Phocaeicola barnesiae]|jgi:hypothetical protein|uniref:hypothetical protein n=1 Tax=Phocaeicola barnesiae TaxID=376804 RepID=UPI0025A4A2B6|nr:hypothetical protein [Phocaeicola barnesiae]MDM8243086.1 hypothetical protein [Phocaeicola barnesiae]